MRANSLGHDRRAIPWLRWMVRYVSSNTTLALKDLIQSVQSVPPYGGASQKEAQAVLELIRQFRGPEMASEQTYENVRKIIARRREANLALKAFQLHDRIASCTVTGQGVYSLDDVLKGLEIASQMNHSGLRAYFLGLHAPLLKLSGEIPEAKTIALEALDILMDLHEKDPVYFEQTLKTAFIAILLTASDGDFPKARQLLNLALSMGSVRLPRELEEMLRVASVFKKNPQAMMELTKKYLIQQYFYRALEYSIEAEQLLLNSGDKDLLCKVLGDQAEAFWRLKNTRRAIETYRRAVAYCRERDDFSNASRWNQNLGLIYMERNELDSAMASFKEAMSEALTSGDSYLVSTAMINSANLFQQQERYQEAISWMEDAESVISENPKLLKILRGNKFAIYERWGKRLQNEGMVDEAIAVFKKGVTLADLEKDLEKESAALIYAMLGRLYESQNDLQKSGVVINRAIELFEELGRSDQANMLSELLRYQRRQGVALREQGSAIEQEPVAEWDQEVQKASASENRRSEALARVNLAASLRAASDRRAMAEFEKALSLVRQVQDSRGECILLLNFIPDFLKREDFQRALELANRAVELADPENTKQRALAFLLLGKVWKVGFNDMTNALKHYRQTVQLAERELEKDVEPTRELIGTLKGLLSEAAQTAIHGGDSELAYRLLELINPGSSREVRSTEKPPQAAQKEPVLPNTGSLRAMRDSELDFVISAWRTPRDIQEKSEYSRSPILRRMATDAQALGWMDAYLRISSVPKEIVTTEASQKGPAGLMVIAELLGREKISEADAVRSARRLEVDDDDLPCLCLFSMQDFARGEVGSPRALFRLCVRLTHEDRFAARLYRILAAGEKLHGDPQQALVFYKNGDDRLSNGTDNMLRAEINNEAALALLELNNAEEALQHARQAKHLAVAAGDRSIATKTAGTLGIVLMSLKRWDEALSVFQWLEKEQEAIEDRMGLSTTSLNITICLAWLGRFDLEGSDLRHLQPELLFNLGEIMVQKDKPDRAIDFYEHGLERIRELEESDKHEAKVRVAYARLLFEAKRKEDATHQLRQAIPLAEKLRDLWTLNEIYGLLADLTITDFNLAASYAERAVALARSLEDPELLARNLGQIAQIRLNLNLPHEAVDLLEEALGLTDLPSLHCLLADAFVALRRFEEARSIYKDQLENAQQTHDLYLKIQSLEGLARIIDKTGEGDQALQLYKEAYRLSSDLKLDDNVVQLCNSLGLALLNRHQYNEALEVLEQGIERAKLAGLRRHELALMNNLARTLREIGDFTSALSLQNRCLSYSRSFGDTRREAYALFELGHIHKEYSHHDKALNCYEEALQITRTLPAPDLEAVCLDSIGSMYVMLNQPGRAVEYHQRAAALHAQVEDWDHHIVDLLNLAQACLILNEADQAKDAVESAERIAEKHGLDRYCWNLTFIKGIVYAKLGNWKGVKQDLIEAIEEILQIGQTFLTPLEEKRWAGRWQTAYKLAAEAAIHASDAPSAFEFVECFRVRYLESIRRKRQNRPTHVDEESWLQHERAAEQLAELQARQRVNLTWGRQQREQKLRNAESEYARSLARVTTFSKGNQLEPAAYQFPSFKDLAQSILPQYTLVSLEMYNEGLGVICAGRDPDGKLWHVSQIDRNFTRVDLSRLLFGASKTERTDGNVHPVI